MPGSWQISCGINPFLPAWRHTPGRSIATMRSIQPYAWLAPFNFQNYRWFEKYCYWGETTGQLATWKIVYAVPWCAVRGPVSGARIAGRILTARNITIAIETSWKAWSNTCKVVVFYSHTRMCADWYRGKFIEKNNALTEKHVIIIVAIHSQVYNVKSLGSRYKKRATVFIVWNMPQNCAFHPSMHASLHKTLYLQIRAY